MEYGTLIHGMSSPEDLKFWSFRFKFPSSSSRGGVGVCSCIRTNTQDSEKKIMHVLGIWPIAPYNPLPTTPSQPTATHVNASAMLYTLARTS